LHCGCYHTLDSELLVQRRECERQPPEGRASRASELHPRRRKLAVSGGACAAAAIADGERKHLGGRPGLLEAEASAQGRKVEIVKFPWGASGRALTFDRIDGLTKLIIDPETERILGVGIVGHGAGELIAEGTMAIEMGATARDLAETVHPHPTLSETLMEAADLFFGHATHAYIRKRAVE